MKIKTIIISLSILFLLTGIVIAGGILTKTDSNIIIDATKEQILKDSIAGSNVVINSGEIICNEKDCWASVLSPGLMDTEFRTSKNYCSKLNETSCLEYTDYTSGQLVQMRDEWIKNRLESYADVIKLRDDTIKSGSVAIAGTGTITINEK